MRRDEGRWATATTQGAPADLAWEILEHLPLAVVAARPAGAVLHANGAAADLLGPVAAGESAPAVFARHPALAPLLSAALAGGSDVPLAEALVESPRLGSVLVEVRTRALRSGHDAPETILVILENVSAARRREKEIRDLETFAALGRFTSAVAHEVRNPLAGIGAGVQYLAGIVTSDDEVDHTVRLILSEVSRLDRIVGDIGYAGKPLRLAIIPTDVRGPIRRSIALCEDAARRRGVRIAAELDESLPDVSLDAERIEQILLNLVKNAIEASEAGDRVVVRTRLDVALAHEELIPSGSTARLAIEVADEGCGVAPDLIGRIFEPFVSGKRGGSGLGLYVSRRIAEAHGGSLRVTSEPDRGSTFRLLLPLRGEGEEVRHAGDDSHR